MDNECICFANEFKSVRNADIAIVSYYVFS